MDTTIIQTAQQLEQLMDREELIEFLHRSLKPFEDPPEQIGDGIDYALDEQCGRGGFIALAHEDGSLAGALVMLDTGMKGYIPENLLLFVAVEPGSRGRGIGGRLIKQALDHAEGSVKLHVEHENPAKRLYERLGFTSDYAEMRLVR